MEIMVVDDDLGLCESLQLHLQRAGHEVSFLHTVEDALDTLQDHRPDLVLVDLDLPDRSGLEILRELQGWAERPLCVMITGVQDSRSTIEAIQLGAFDYLRKPLELKEVRQAVEKAQALAAQQKAPVATPSIGRHAPLEIVGAHPAIIEVLKQVAFIAESRVPVLIEGESGTGKELVARALHETATPEQPFVAVNCSAVVATLLESELFGHEKGAFTGADAMKTGKLELAAAGTIFFDEIGDMAHDLQAKLLRVLQEKEFERVGGARTVPFRARVIAATNRDLRRLLVQGLFREDLYYRLQVSSIRLPPLRDRRSDIPLLTSRLLGALSQEFKREIKGIEEAGMHLLETHDWPGNIRELRNVLTRAVLLSREAVISRDLVALAIGGTAPRPAASSGDIQTLGEAERDHLFKVLVLTDWNITRAALMLDIGRATLRRKIAEYGLRKPH